MTQGSGPIDESLRFACPALRAASGLPEGMSVREMASLRKRLFVPAWWCEGILVKHGAKDPLTQSFAQRQPERLVVLSPVCAPKNFPLLFQVWNELVSQALSGKGASRLVRVPLDRFLRGTSIDIADSVRFLETYWASSFQVRGGRALSASGSSRRGKSASARSGSINFVRYCAVETGESPGLVIELALPLGDFVGGRLERVLPSFLCEDAFASKGAGTNAAQISLVATGVVSANPDVLRAFGTGVSFRKLVSYLFIEFAKAGAADVFERDGWHGRPLASRDLVGLHEGLLQRTKALYDHGVFGWDNSAPRARVREVRGGVSVVHCWRLSQQAMSASAIEGFLREEFELSAGVQAPVVEIAGGRAGATSGMFAAQRSVQAPAPAKAAPSAAAIDTQTLPKAAPVPALFVPTPRRAPAAASFSLPEAGNADSELMLCVLEYYSSLPPRQQRMFQTQKARMSDDEFRAYVLPLLKRRPEPGA